MNYNLLEEKWIPILWKDGNADRVGIIEAFTQAGRIRQIAASNPMDRVAILRFLLALLYWCQGNPPDKIPDNPFPADWFRKLDDNRKCFNLLGNGKRFYQCVSDKTKKHTVNYLIQEVPTGTNFWHFRHSIDNTNGLCPACCVLGLLRVPLFATSGGQGKPPGINQKPPIYVFPLGLSLAETLLLSWRKVSNLDLGTPAWVKSDLQLSETSEVPLLVGLTWLPRRVWLDNPEELEAKCISCGRRESLIRQCVFAGIGSTQPITKAALKMFPENIIIPEKLKKNVWFDKTEEFLILKGNMSEKDRDMLLKLSSDDSYQKSVNLLYSSQPHRGWSDPQVICDTKAVVTAGNALDASDAAAKQWVNIMTGNSCMKCKYPTCPQSIAHQMKNTSLWIVGFATVENDKYLEVTEDEIPGVQQYQQEQITKWKEDKLMDNLRKILRDTRKPRKDDMRIAISGIASIRPHVEYRVSAKVDELIAGGDEEWEKASEEYRPMMTAIAMSISPGFTSAAVQRRNRIAGIKPNMQQKTKAPKRATRKKGGDK
ncbi:MAG: type I-E CRISPR-associated protein Cse1/CasA [Nitrospiraceae bacterium]|nr:type I-E CRISPR-associated protein Cse1/CasA [Nitrospiraceae bacterium]